MQMFINPPTCVAITIRWYPALELTGLSFIYTFRFPPMNTPKIADHHGEKLQIARVPEKSVVIRIILFNLSGVMKFTIYVPTI